MTKKAKKVSKRTRAVSIGELALAIHNSYLCQQVLKGREKSEFVSRLLTLPVNARATVCKLFAEEAKEQGKLDAAMEKDMGKLRAEYLEKLKVVVKDAKKKSAKKHEETNRHEEEKAADALLNQLDNI